MPSHLTPSQVLGEIGEAAARLRFLTIGFQFDSRSRPLNAKYSPRRSSSSAIDIITLIRASVFSRLGRFSHSLLK